MDGKSPELRGSPGSARGSPGSGGSPSWKGSPSRFSPRGSLKYSSNVSHRSRSLSPTKRPRGRVWRPPMDKPFDSSIALSERTTTTYSARDDKHLNPEYRGKLKGYELSSSSQYALMRDRIDTIMVEKKTVLKDQRKAQLHRLKENRPEMFERSWDLQPEQRAYYPSTISAGGSELCPIRRALQISPTREVLDNQSLLAHPHWGSLTHNSSAGHGSSINQFRLPSSRSQFSLAGSAMTNNTMTTTGGNGITRRKYLCSHHQATVDL